MWDLYPNITDSCYYGFNLVKDYEKFIDSVSLRYIALRYNLSSYSNTVVRPIPANPVKYYEM